MQETMRYWRYQANASSHFKTSCCKNNVKHVKGGKQAGDTLRLKIIIKTNSIKWEEM